MKPLKKLLLNSLVLLFAATAGWCGRMTSQNDEWVITKDLLGASGSSYLTSSDYALAFAWGEPLSGNLISTNTYILVSGYYGGRFGSLQGVQLLSWNVGTANSRTFFQDRFQVGVPFDAPIRLTFSDQMNRDTIPAGIRVVMAMDHLGNTSDATASFRSDFSSQTITLQPQDPWLGNTLYDVQVTPELLSAEGDPVDQVYHVYFVTMLDHRQENVVLEPIVPAGEAADVGPAPVGVMSIGIPTESLSDFSAVLLSRDPLNQPLRVDPKIIREANDKARAAGGPYRVPIAIQEVSAYNARGELMGPLSKPAQLTLSYGGGLGAPASASVVRPRTLSLWVLDESHKLWVKMPASQNSLGAQTVSAPVTQFSVFALMGSADGSASDSYAFPVPWRPHGPNAGTDPGQSGTEADGINFSNIPSECTIKIYTIAGDLVRTLHHSDVGSTPNQERWDVKTTHGDAVASGVYIWRVESSIDSKNGKLMVIR